ncbi:hypothetical protein [Pedobacter hartonius]|uniref:Lipocalin-like domain-containing protein n=1 Tax=Pedobacter hartonius TaxID=425514 RepID=A0A1H4BP10_9SPHI|nr:hypothetical protein [Pedobacter hartonius]SEA49873.1 hypothetical protein SAMN05443550_103420 [Pedobacter hartonius]
MKKMLTLSLCMILLLSAFSCKKKSVESAFNGTWELRYIEGIQIAGADPNFKAGNGNVLKFSESNYERYVDHQLIDSGTFAFQKEEVRINNSQSNYSILLKNNEKVYINLSGKKLIVFYGQIAADGVENHYEKQ